MLKLLNRKLSRAPKFSLKFIGIFLVANASVAQIEMKSQRDDVKVLSELNSQFIRNFVNQDTVAHNKIIHPDFVCIQSTGEIVERKDYMTEWANGYSHSGYKTFSYTDENIRIFGNMALVRSRTVYTKDYNGRTITGSSIYTDTYIKEKGKWICVQAHITPVK